MRRWKRKRLLRREQETVLDQCGCALAAGARPGNGSVGAVPLLQQPRLARNCPPASEPISQPNSRSASAAATEPAAPFPQSAARPSAPLAASQPASQLARSRSSPVVPAAGSQPAGPLWEQLVRRGALSSSNPPEQRVLGYSAVKTRSSAEEAVGAEQQ
ncbi:uncharacterized protein LOC128782879 [Vidua chalybeata]|uniref:uncharacterized protein LOC128782879 n=1 Tax=Vidua chalybeata TaxID=81927 RepID=UPI0023A8072E|nr:uncharacterized protein LOC128782879 [Vidua chalybeata]XP_053789369.1 uncharacterized protein LOC128782879 [Vidua chalybeata]